MEVDAFHLYLGVAADLGYDLYKQISQSTWLSESLFAALLYPERISTIARFWKRRVSRSPLLRKYEFVELCRELEIVSSRILARHWWERYDLAGFSICFGQLTSSLYFIQEIKKRAPSLQLVVGGSACAGEMGESLLRIFPEINYVVNGEGELPLVHLIQSLERERDNAGPIQYPGIVSRYGGGPLPEQENTQVERLDDLPFPDYGDYFDQLESLGADRAFLPRIPMEMSRGCWWKRGSGNKGRGCAFCNLNLQWQGYRAKSRQRVVEEIDVLTERHQILSISFMDNILPPKNLDSLFFEIAKIKKELRLFTEIRATTSSSTLAAMAQAGVEQVQVGIEALSTRLLKKLNKGTTAMDNVEIMKNCETPGLPDLTGNLILCFPGSDEADVAETLHNLDFVLPFRPLRGIHFWLGYRSGVWRNPRAYGIKKMGNHSFYGHLFPPPIFKGLRLMIQGYQGGVRYQKRLWAQVKEKIDAWAKSYAELHSTPGSGPILSYLDGGHFMIIRQRRPGKEDMTHRLKGSSREIYLFCESQRSLPRIVARFSAFGEDQIRGFLKMMVEKRLMFNEGELYLSLAVPLRASCKSRGSLQVD